MTKRRQGPKPTLGVAADISRQEPSSTNRQRSVRLALTLKR